jgi:hypothetical protein
MLRAGGLACIVDPDLGTKEADTFTCVHCQKITHVKAGVDPYELGGHCRLCNALICKDCVGKECTPFMKRVEEEEERAFRMRNYGGL